MCLPVGMAYACFNSCCADNSYCDSSAGRMVGNNGDYSVCYCNRHAVMNLHKLKGCCLWHGGVLKISPAGQVMCRDGDISEICSIENPKEKVAVF